MKTTCTIKRSHKSYLLNAVLNRVAEDDRLLDLVIDTINTYTEQNNIVYTDDTVPEIIQKEYTE